jgi:hypothetical protein
MLNVPYSELVNLFYTRIVKSLLSYNAQLTSCVYSLIRPIITLFRSYTSVTAPTLPSRLFVNVRRPDTETPTRLMNLTGYLYVYLGSMRKDSSPSRRKSGAPS